jgi:hypothetical protein
MKNLPKPPPVLPRGRVAGWSKEQLDKLSTDDLKALLVNAKGLNEAEVAAACDEILGSRRSKARAAKKAS